MSVHSQNTTLNRLQKETVHVTLQDRDGNVDTTTSLDLSTDDPTIATVGFANDPRTVNIVGVAPGTTTIRIAATLPAASGGQQLMNISTTVIDSPDVSGISVVIDPAVPKS